MRFFWSQHFISLAAHINFFDKRGAMKALIQRVSRASVEVDGELVGSIGQGLLLFLGVEKRDDRQVADKMLSKILSYRVFENGQGRMDLSLADIEGGLLVVSQFTLVAKTNKGKRPSFSSAAPPSHGELIYDHFLTEAKSAHGCVESGKFGADMKVGLINDGPVTFLLAT